MPEAILASARIAAELTQPLGRHLALQQWAWRVLRRHGLSTRAEPTPPEGVAARA